MWSNKYLGIPYLHHGRDETGIDCWGLVRLVYKQEYQVDLPSFVESYLEDDRIRSEELIAQYREGWEELDAPQEGCVVVLRVMGHLSHVGVCINERQFLHAQEGSGSSVQDFDGVKWSRRVSGFYRYREAAGAVLNAVPHPLKTERVVMAIVPGTNLEELYTQVKQKIEVSSALEKTIHIFVNGVLIPRVAWTSTVLQSSDVVEYRSVPEKETARILLTIALVVVAATIAGPMGAQLAASMGVTTATGVAVVTAGVQAAIVIAGSYLINAVLPIRPPTQNDPGSTTAQLMVNGGQNQATPYGAVPVVLGKVRMTPPLAMNSFVTFDNVAGKSTAFLNMVLAWGYGPLSINETSFRVGKADLVDYDNVTQETIAYFPSAPLAAEIAAFNTIAAGDVVQNYSGLELVQNYKSVASGVTQAEWNTAYGGDNNGTYFMRQKNFSGNYADTVYRSVWSNYSETVLTRPDPDTEVFKTNEVLTSEVYTLADWTESTFNQQLDQVTVAIGFPQGLRKIKVKSGDTETTSVSFEVQSRYRNSTNTAWLSWPSTGTTITVTRNEKDGFTYTQKFDLDKTQLGTQFRIRRTTDTNSEPNADDRLSHVSVLHSFTGYYSDPDYPPHTWAPTRPTTTTVAKTAFRIQATDQLNGNVEGISAVVQTIAKVWNGTNWSTLAPTSNPAALFLYVLTHPANPQRVEEADITSKVDLVKLQYWYNYCENYQAKTSGGNVSQKLEYNSVLGSQKSVLEVLRDICAAGRGSPALKDGKWTVTIDEPQSVVVQHFTPHNSWGFESVKALPKYPNAFKVQYYNEDKNYQQDEIILPAAGYTKDTAELFETITLPGITNEVLADDFGRWHYAQIKLRPEVYTLNTDIEYLVCNRGDRVKVLHDVPMWGLQSGRIKNRLSSDIFELDEELPITENQNYTVRFRGVSNTGVGTNQVLNTERQVKTTFDLTSYSAGGGNVTLTIGTHPLQVGDRVAVVVTGVSSVSTTTAVVNLVTATTIRYGLINSGFAATTAATGTVKLKDGYYTKIQTTTTTTQYEAGSGDLFMFGKLQQESQDLVVISIEPTNGAKNARLTLVDYGVQAAISGGSAGYNIFTDYYNYTGLAYYSNITDTPVLQIDFIGDKKPEILSERIVSNESVMTKVADNTFIFAIRVPFVQDFTLPPTVTHVEGQIDQNGNNVSYKRALTEIDKTSITFNDVEQGKAYRIRLRYVDSQGRVGGWTDWVAHTVIGMFSPPPDVTNFSYLAQPGGIKFTWDKPDVVDYKTTIIKDITGANWATGITLFEGNVTTWTWTNVVTNSYVIAARHLDQADLLSSNNSTLSISYLALELAAVRVELDNDTHNIPAKEDGTDPVLALSGTDIEVYQGGSLLKYDAVGTAAGRWRIVSAAGTNCTPGTIAAVVNSTTGDDYARVSDLTVFSATQDTGEITFTISGKTTTGVVFTATKTQTFAKVKNGENPIIYKIFMSTKAVYKNSSSWLIDGPFNEIRGGAKKYVGNTSSNFGYLGITPYNIQTQTWGTESRVFVGNTDTDGIVFSPSATDKSSKFKVRLYETNISTTVLDTEELPVVTTGDIGLSTALVYAYKRSAAVVTDNPGAIIYTFSSNSITTPATLDNSWSKTIPTGTDPLYVTVATASSNTGTDNIAQNEWTAPIIQTQSGINSATIYLYSRNNSSSSAPTFRTNGSSTYTFSTGDITGFDSTWSDAIPNVSSGDVIWVVQATAASTSATDSIADSEWSTPQVLANKGNSAARFSIDNAASTFAKDKAGVVSPSGGITLTTSASNFTSITYQWQKNGVDISGATNSSYVVPTTDYSSVNTNTYRCNATGTINGVASQTLNDSITIPRLDDGTNSPTVVLSNENVTFPGPLSGYSGIVFTGGDCTVTAYLGTVQLTYNTTGANTFSVSQSTTGATVAAGTTGANSYSVPAPTAMSVDAAYTDVVITIRDAAGTALASTITRRISYSLSRRGATGAASTVPGGTGPRTAQIYYYYTSNSSSTPTAPLTTEVSYNFANSTAASTNTSWATTFPAPAPTVTSSNNKYWAILVTFSESSFGGSQNTPAISAPFNWLNFEGLVTFNNLATATSANGTANTTFINGGCITTNSITVDSLKAGTSAVSGGRTFGLGIGAVVNAQQAAVVGSAIRVDANTPNSGVSGGAFSTTTNNGYGLLAGCVDGTVGGAVVTGSAIGAYNATSSAFSTFNTQVAICNKDQLLFGFKNVPGTSAKLSDATLASNLHGASFNFHSETSPYNRISTALLASGGYAGNFQYRNASNNTALTSADIATATHSFIGVGDMSVTGSIFATGNLVGYSSSDIRYKTKIKPLNNSLNALCAIDGISFEWTDEFYNKIPKISRKLVKRKDIGIIAQQVKKVFPQIVNTDADGMLAVNYEKLVPVLIEAIKELKLKVEVLEGKQNVQL